ncbi:Hsp20/alpha crystallin family protein [Variovorax sp. VNK109]|jgi:HSP20 family protein|uniref:Hsp20/alpha crystallin family protein n=1 Tax=Variovorax sp. VNK109 TaxID=3400919 RepID=UPI003C07DDD9
MFFAPVLRTRAYAPALRSFDRSFERFFNDALQGSQHAANVEQDDASWSITLDVPGVSREQLDIGIEGNVVRVATKAEATRQYKAAYEFAQEIDVAASEAKLENGVLTLKLGKKAPVSNVTQLTVQ